jgi:SAM-dependent methyltransferase
MSLAAAPAAREGQEDFAREDAMSDRFHYDAGASGYDQGFGRVSAIFIPTLLQSARLATGHRVLDVATGTGIAAEAAASSVGPSGHVVATDISGPILDQARKRLRERPNVSFAIEDGAALTFAEGSFDAVLCSMGLMLFPDPGRGLVGFHRVLRRGGKAAVSVNTTPDRSFVARISSVIARYVPSRATAAGRFFSLGDAARLQTLFTAAGFHAVEISTETRRFPFSSFDAYFEPTESGLGNVGVEYRSLPVEVRHAVREDLRRNLEADGPPGCPIDVDVQILFASGRK